MTVIQPLPGPQTKFCATPADIAIYGSGLGSGKTFGLLLQPLYYIEDPELNVVAFRSTTQEAKRPKGMWGESQRLYHGLGGFPQRSPMCRWNFPSGASISFSHLRNHADALEWRDSLITQILIDELDTFDELDFWFLLSRCQRTSMSPATLRATVNANKDSWVSKFIDWWIGDDGYPIEERIGRPRWFVRVNDEVFWAGSPDELLRWEDEYGFFIRPRSVTYIPATLNDNPILMRNDPAYAAGLMALNACDRERNLHGNWRASVPKH